MVTSMLPARPTVAAIVPCLNEAKFIGHFLDSILAMDIDPELLTVWVVDGMSTDGTREILTDYARGDSRVRMLDNPRRTTACALNIGLRSSRSDVVVRFDVHAEYPPNYISHLVSLLQRHRVDNVGAVRITATGSTARENAIASLISSPFASGGAPWRSRPSKLSEVESVYCGCFPREVFDRVGFFDESMIRIEDREFNARIRQKGGRILLDPALTCTYYPRTHIRTYLKWTFSGPFRIFYSRRLTDTPLVSARNLAPAAFILYHLLLPIGFWLIGWPAFLPLAAYVLTAIWAACSEAMLYRRWTVAVLLPPLFYMTHLLYGVGSIWGWLRSLLPIAPPRPEGKFSH
jgi:cellulose synthase/poly-beta-1,6-N-acetylglucosamine synthase-like glycosyltransferase